jgi:hypothetical protein
MGYLLSPIDEFERIKLNPFVRSFLSEFKKPPFENVFYKYADFLIKNSDSVGFKNEWNFSPFAAAYEIYGEKYLYPIFFVVNKIPYSIFYFTAQYIDNLLFPPITLIKEILEGF